MFLFSNSFSYPKNDIYLSGPLFALAEREFNSALAEHLRQLGYTVFLPQEQEPRELTAECIFSVDVKGIDDSSAVVAIFDGPDPDSGTSWECGYAYAKESQSLQYALTSEGLGMGRLRLITSCYGSQQATACKCSVCNTIFKRLYSDLKQY
ncbi:MAG TPA: nucleoside 2-deoxyribosyltransferase [Rhabdochlamydiaceae bacterium]